MRSFRYLACAIDTEGSIHVSRGSEGGRYLVPRVTVANTNLRWLQLLRKQFGGRIQRMYFESKEKNHKSGYFLYFRLPEVKQLLPKCLPYLIIKKQQAKLLLALMSIRKTERPRDRITGRFLRKKSVKREQKIIAQICALNKRGFV